MRMNVTVPIKKAYFNRLNELISSIEQSNADKFDEAASVIAETMAIGGGIHVFDTGHLLSYELFNRAGGLVAFQPLKIHLSVENQVRDRGIPKLRNMEGFMKYALQSSKVCPGDVMIIGSVSGKSTEVVDLAKAAKEIGAFVIAVTSLSYSTILRSDHSSGERLFELADLVLDNCAEPMDAMLEIPGLDAHLCPASGISAAVIMWAIEALVAERLIQKGIRPSVLKSANAPGTEAFNNQAYEQYAKFGY
ncbi:sugar isomerase domain-containing protein [Cohnella zeiphila]|uniref:Sugar isomerase domain-containing protein n=1 Tax=Cohnella zeiphila TaxID=2761120 RepID=A0A7X0VV07_9BACL|nr:sugar isomerase domain-containing protein [Cohnella zeiphila]MBB6730867.1 sugar isomerase domain-containing protein [Cohnella zeiphila]